MTKISVIGAGNVGGLSALRIAQENMGDVCLIDISAGLAKGKCLDMSDSFQITGINNCISSSENIDDCRDSDIIILTAGLPRKPGMSREDLLRKNAEIVKSVCLKIKALSPSAVVIVVTNPLDVMVWLALKLLGSEQNKVFGMGSSLDSARFSNLISEELNIPRREISAVVIGAHGIEMLPLPRLSTARGTSLEELMSREQLSKLSERTINRGAEIVKNLGTGSAYFAPSAAIASIVKAIIHDSGETIPVSCMLKGEYGIHDICIGIPCKIGRKGIKEILQLSLTEEESASLLKSADSINESIKTLNGILADI